MTLNIDLEDVPDAILEAVKARIMANRRRLIDNQDQRLSPALRPGPQIRKQGADSRTWRRAEPAAVPNQQPQDFAISYQSGGDLVWGRFFSGRVHSADGTASVALQQAVIPSLSWPPIPANFEMYSLGADNSFQPASYYGRSILQVRYFYLPAGGRSYVLVQSQKSIAAVKIYLYGPIGINTDGGYNNIHFDEVMRWRTTTAYFVGDSVARQIGLPSAVRLAVEDQLFKDYATREVTRTNAERQIVNTFNEVDDPDGGPPLFGDYLGQFQHFGQFGLETWSPSMLQVLKSPATTLGTFGSLQSAQAYRSNSEWQVSYGNVQSKMPGRLRTIPIVDARVSDLLGGFYYRWKGTAEKTNDNIFNPALYFTERTLRPYPAPGQRSAEAVIWDGGDPAYCRQALIDLGFSQQDITP